jgi:hypothetical protein
MEESLVKEKAQITIKEQHIKSVKDAAYGDVLPPIESNIKIEPHLDVDEMLIK